MCVCLSVVVGQPLVVIPKGALLLRESKMCVCVYKVYLLMSLMVGMVCNGREEVIKQHTKTYTQQEETTHTRKIGVHLESARDEKDTRQRHRTRTQIARMQEVTISSIL